MTVFKMPVMIEILTSPSSFLTKLESVIITPNPSESAKKTCPKTSTKSFKLIFEKSGVK